MNHSASVTGAWRLFVGGAIAWILCALAISIPQGGSRVLIGIGLVTVAVLPMLFWRRAKTAKLRRSTCELFALPLGVSLLIGAAVMHGQVVRDAPELQQAVDHGGRAAFVTLITDYPQVRVTPFGERTQVTASVTTSNGQVPVQLFFDGPCASKCALGKRLTVDARVRRLEQWRPEAYQLLVNTWGVDAAASAWWGRLMEHLGERLTRQRLALIQTASVTDGAVLVPGLAIGDTSLVNQDLYASMQSSGLTHVVAVSGANCALVIGGVAWIISWLGGGRRLRIVGGVLALGAFVALVGPDSSVMRAAVMATVVLWAKFGGRPHVAMSALGSAMIVLLLCNPWQALDAGFALSVTATGGLLVLSPALRRRMPSWLPSVLALPVAIAAAAALACAPLLLLLQPGIGLGAIIANVLVAPVAPWGTASGLLGLLVLDVSPPIAQLCIGLGALAGRWIEAVAVAAERLPLARLPWPQGVAGCVLLCAVYVLLGAAWLIVTGRVSIRIRGRTLRRMTRRPWQRDLGPPFRLRLIALALVAPTIGVVGALWVAIPVRERLEVPNDWFMVACDVGQGDAILVRDPRNHANVTLIDTGNEPEQLIDCLDRFGVTRISLLMLSHDDQDHVGAVDALRGRVTKAVVAPDNAEEGERRPILQRLSRLGIRWQKIGAGTRWESDTVQWDVVGPLRTPTTRNEASLIVRVQCAGVRILLLGDSDRNEQQALVHAIGDLRVDIVKVAHHGSRDEDENLLQAARAQLGVISVGAQNSYGHPSLETLDALDAAKTIALRTDRLGSVAISGTPELLKVWAEHPNADAAAVGARR